MVPPTPSLTLRGKQWLNNFSSTERSTATLLLDSLEIVSPTDIRVGLLHLLNSLTDEEVRKPAVLIPVLSVKDIVFPKGHSGLPVAYVNFAPGSPIASTPGSEGLIGNIVRELTGSESAAPSDVWLHPSRDVKALRAARCHTLVFLTDYCGSGDQVTRFARAFVRNATIRSWRSYGWTKVHVVAFAASVLASERIQRDTAVDYLSVAGPAASFVSAQWTTEEREAIKTLCVKYLTSKERRQTFGYKGSAGLFVTHTGVPNNVPKVLTRTATGWHPFFEGTVCPPDLVRELASYSPKRDLRRVTKEARQTRVSAVLESGRLRGTSETLIAMLSLVSLKAQTRTELSHALHQSEERIQELLGFLVGAGLLKSDLRLTWAGRMELLAGKRLPRRAGTQLEGEDVPYYPVTLR